MVIFPLYLNSNLIRIQYLVVIFPSWLWLLLRLRSPLLLLLLLLPLLLLLLLLPLLLLLRL